MLKNKKYIEIIKKLDSNDKTNLTALEKLILKLDKKIKKKNKYINEIKKVLKHISNLDLYTIVYIGAETLNQNKSTRKKVEMEQILTSQQGNNMREGPCSSRRGNILAKARSKDNKSLNCKKSYDEDKQEDYAQTPNTCTNSNKTQRQRENDQKKERIKQILDENNINETFSNLDTLDIDTLNSILVNKPQGQPPSIIKKVQEELDRRYTESTLNEVVQNESVSSKSNQDNSRKRKNTANSTSQEKRTRYQRSEEGERTEMNNEKLIYTATIKCQKIERLKDDDERKQQENIWATLNELKLKGVKHASMIQKDGTSYIRISTSHAEDFVKIENKITTNAGKLSIIEKDIESKLMMICYGFKESYNEEDDYEAKKMEKCGIKRVTRKTQTNNKKAKWMMLDIVNNEAFCKLYINGIHLGTEKCTVEPKWRQPKFCKRCKNWDHFEEDCVEDELECYKCGSDDHSHASCREAPLCIFCEDEKLNSDHLTTDENECTIYKRHFDQLNSNYINIIKQYCAQINENFEMVYPKNMSLRWQKKKHNVENIKLTEIEKKIYEMEEKHNELSASVQKLDRKVEHSSRKLEEYQKNINDKLDTVVTKNEFSELTNLIKSLKAQPVPFQQNLQHQLYQQPTQLISHQTNTPSQNDQNNYSSLHAQQHAQSMNFSLQNHYQLNQKSAAAQKD